MLPFHTYNETSSLQQWQNNVYLNDFPPYNDLTRRENNNLFHYLLKDAEKANK